MVYQCAFLKETSNVLKLLKKNLYLISTDVNHNLTWEFESLISFGIELSGQSIRFIIYDALSDATLITKRNRDEMAVPTFCVRRQKCAHIELGKVITHLFIILQWKAAKK